jgi:exodeoxyribonuclease-3
MTIIASWNINSVRTRLDLLKKFINQINPDVVLLQEIKCTNEDFPDFYSNLGFKAIINGQKGKYGVATLLKKEIRFENLSFELEVIKKESRTNFIYLKDLNLKIINVYTPNGNPIENETKFKFKIQWLENMKRISKGLIANYDNFIIGGDFNVIEHKDDVTNFKIWENDALGDLEVRRKFREILYSGLTNIVRLYYKPGEKFSFWDYQKASWERNDGLLIDHFLASPKILGYVKSINFETKYRGMEKPSDHVPIWINLDI